MVVEAGVHFPALGHASVVGYMAGLGIPDKLYVWISSLN